MLTHWRARCCLVAPRPSPAVRNASRDGGDAYSERPNEPTAGIDATRGPAPSKRDAAALGGCPRVCHADTARSERPHRPTRAARATRVHCARPVTHVLHHPDGRKPSRALRPCHDPTRHTHARCLPPRLQLSRTRPGGHRRLAHTGSYMRAAIPGPRTHVYLVVGQ